MLGKVIPCICYNLPQCLQGYRINIYISLHYFGLPTPLISAEQTVHMHVQDKR